MTYLSIKEYFYNNFWEQQKNFMADKQERFMGDLSFGRFFGENDWGNFDKDMQKIQPEERALFLSTLFISVLLDQAIYTYYTEAYENVIKGLPQFPKFGYFGFGPHYLNPFYILKRASSNESLYNEIVDLMPDFAKLFVDETVSCLNRLFASKIKPSDLFVKIIKDPAYTLIGESQQASHAELKDDKAVNTFKAKFEEYLSEQKYI